MGKPTESSPEKVNNYHFELPDRSVKHPFERVMKTKEQLVKDLQMINGAIDLIGAATDCVDWSLLMPTSSLTVTFIEAKTGLMASRKKFAKIKHTIELEIAKHA